MSAMTSQITSLTIVYSTVYSGADRRKHQSSVSLAFVQGIHRWPVNSPHKWPVTRRMLPFDDTIMDFFPQIGVNHKRQEPAGYRQAAVVEDGVNLRDFYLDTEWSILGTVAEVNIMYYPCCQEHYPVITFTVGIRRKPLFYYANLIIPCMIFNLLTCVVFTLPQESGEKISFSISILLALGVFQIYLMDIMPETSLSLPIVGKYIMFTNYLIALSVFTSIITTNISRRSASTHSMPRWVRFCFMRVLPSILCMKVPEKQSQRRAPQDTHEEDIAAASPADISGSSTQPLCEGCVREGRNKYPKLMREALEGIDVIVEQMTSANRIILVSGSHYSDVIMGAIASQITSVSIVYHSFKRRSKKTSKLRDTGLCEGIHRSPVNSPHKGPVTRTMFPFDYVIIFIACITCPYISKCDLVSKFR